MVANILVTGAAGYIGGSIVADFLLSKDSIVSKAIITAAVRSNDQLEALAKTGVNVVRLDLTDRSNIIETVLKLNVNIIIHTASSINPDLAKNLIIALGKQKEAKGTQTHFIHTSALSAFFPRTGWPEGEFHDTDDIFGKEKELADSFPVRKTDVDVIEYSKKTGVRSYVVVPCAVYGKGTGAWNQLSVVLPIVISAALTQKAVYKFLEDTKLSASHISDLTALYASIAERIINNDSLERNEKGIYFAIAHDLYFHDVAADLAIALHTRELVTESTTKTFESTEQAAEILGVPAPFVQALWNSSANITPHNDERLGWKPKWGAKEFHANIEDEVKAVLELGKAKSSLIESLRAAAKG